MVYRRLNCQSCADVLCCRSCCGERDCCSCLIPKSAPEASRMMTFGGFLFFVACLFVGMGFLVPALLDRSLERGLHQLKALDSTDSRAYSLFSDNHEYPIKLSIYVMNVTNHAAVVNEGATPVIQEVGPYVYLQYRRALNVSWTPDATELNWRYFSRFVFQPQESAGDHEKDMVYSPNVIFWGLAASLRDTNPGQLVVVATFSGLDDVGLAFVKRSPRDVIFGYAKETDPILKIVGKDHEGLITNFTSEDDALKRAKYDTIRTGYPDIRTLHQLVQYQGQEVLRNADNSSWAWANPELGRVRGSDGGMFPLPINQYSKPTVFVSSYYRSIDLDYVERRTYKGVHLERFAVPATMWLSKDKVPDNIDFDQIRWDGLLNLTSPTSKVPFYLSRPRFHMVDEDALTNMHIEWLPEAADAFPSDYETFFDVEPTMGASMSVVTNSQLNLQLAPFTVTYMQDDKPTNRTFCPNMTTFMAPLFWANQSVMISDKDASDFVGSVYAVFDIMRVTPIVCYSIAGAIALIALLIALRGYKYHQLYRFEGHVFVESDNVDNNFASDAVIAQHRHSRFTRGKPARPDGGDAGDAEGVGLDSLAAHYQARNGRAHGRRYGATGESQTAVVAVAGAIAMDGNGGNGAVRGQTAARGSGTGSRQSSRSRPRNDNGSGSNSGDGSVERTVAVDAPELDMRFASDD